MATTQIANAEQLNNIARMGQGVYWQDIAVGQQWRTFRRTITEADLVGFINVTGMLEAIFIDAEFDEGAIKGRPVPGALTYTLIEGFILQSMIQGTGLAMLELHQKILGPVIVGAFSKRAGGLTWGFIFTALVGVVGACLSIKLKGSTVAAHK